MVTHAQSFTDSNHPVEHNKPYIWKKINLNQALIQIFYKVIYLFCAINSGIDK